MDVVSKTVVNGQTRTPDMCIYKAMGLDDEDLSKPLVDVSSTCNQAKRRNIHSRDLAQLSKAKLNDSILRLFNYMFFGFLTNNKSMKR